jgi:hypothetical protein
MALAAESGTDVVVSLGNAGLSRATDALARLQTLAALPALSHVARASARGGVPMRVLTADPLTMVVAAGTVEAGHETTETLERRGRSRIVYVGEGRPAAAGLVMTTRAHPAAAFALGSFREEATLSLVGLRGGAGALTAGTAEPAQAGSVLLVGSTLLGPAAYQASADLRADPTERTMVAAANRLMLLAVAAIVAGTVLAWAGLIDPGVILSGVSGA